MYDKFAPVPFDKLRVRQPFVELVETNERCRFVIHPKFPIWELCLYLWKQCEVRVIAKKTLQEFWEKHQDCEQQLKSWYHEATETKWTHPSDIKKDHPSAGILENKRIVFNIKGNKYRLIVRISYKYGQVWILFTGTRGQYDKKIAATV